MQKFPMVSVIVIGLAIFLTSADPCDHSGCHKMVTTCTGQVVLISGQVGHQPYLFFGQVNPREITLFKIKRCVSKHVSAKHNVYSQVFPSIK